LTLNLPQSTQRLSPLEETRLQQFLDSPEQLLSILKNKNKNKSSDQDSNHQNTNKKKKK